MAVQRQMDAVDTILQQWHRERPDLDVSPMGVIGRLGRCASLLRITAAAACARPQAGHG